MPVHAVELQVLDLVRDLDLVLDLLVRLAFDQRVAAELAGQHDQRAVEQAARLQVEH